MKKFTLLMVALLLSVVGVKAKTETKTLWEGTDTGADIEIAKTNLVKGATLNLTFSWVGSDGAQFSCFWWNSSTSEWVKIKNCQWVNNGESYSFTLTNDEFDAITNDKLCFKTEVPTIMKFTKITQTETFVPTSESENLLSENWESSKTKAQIFAPVNNAKIGDVLQFTVTTAEVWKWVQFKLTDKNGNVDQFTGEGSEPQGSNANTSFTLEFVISTVADLVKIMSDGFGVIQTGNNAFTLTAVKLLSYSDSQDAVEEVEMGSDGIMTYSNIYNLDFSDTGLTPYYTTSATTTTGKVTLTPVADKTTWNYQGYILKGDAGTYYPKVIGNNSGTYPNNNLLKGNTGESSITASTSSTFHYIFAKNKSGGTPAFYKLTAAHTLAAHKAYLETATDITPDASAPVLLQFLGGDVTGVKAICDFPVSDLQYGANGCYDLSGRKVDSKSVNGKLRKGIYIVNGRKVVVK